MIEFRRIVVGPLDTNCWVLHSAGEALLVDPGDEPDRVLAAVADLNVTAILVTHAHFDHVLGADAVATALDVPVLGHRAEEQVWQHELAYLREHGHFDAGLDPSKPTPNTSLWNGTFDQYVTDTVHIGSSDIRVLFTPGHTPGGTTLAVPGHLFTGDTLFPGGPGLTGWPLSDFPTIITSVRELLEFPPDTVIHPGHGPDTTVGKEKPAFPDWVARGW